MVIKAGVRKLILWARWEGSCPSLIMNLWAKGIEGMIKLRILKVLRLFWVIRESLKCQGKFSLRRKADGVLIMEQRVVEDEGRAWSDIAISQGKMETIRGQKQENGIFPGPPKRAALLQVPVFSFIIHF